MKIKNITLKNFMSVGAVTQSINLDSHGLTLVLGDNIDLGSNGNRNGVGKTVLIQAIAYALFDRPMTKIRVDNLVNKTNNKNMMVVLDFEKNGHIYRIERGRKPSIFKFFIDNVDMEKENIAQGNNRDSNKEIIKLSGISHQLFKHIVALSSKTVPFLSESAQKQKEIIEELVRVTQLSAKADILKDNMKDTKAEIDREEMRHKMILENNEKTKRTIDQLTIKSNGWDVKHNEILIKLEQQINKIMELDINAEIENHKVLKTYNEKQRDLREAERILKSSNDILEHFVNDEKRETNNFTQLLNHVCHACGQDIHDDKHVTMVKETEAILEEIITKRIKQEEIITFSSETVADKNAEFIELKTPDKCYYEDIHDAYEHKKNLDNLISMMEKETISENPHVDQIQMVKDNNLQEIDYTLMNEFVNLLNHQDFLYKLLTKKDSVIRVQIIEQNLAFLNNRLDFYITQLSLPYKVTFLGDLNVDITTHGQFFDFEQLSSGQSTRLVLALSWAFRDMYEVLNAPINLMFIDELIDSGMDASGGENALAVLKHMTRDNNKNIFLISHKDEFVARVSNVLMVEFENNFTNYRYDTDLQI